MEVFKSVFLFLFYGYLILAVIHCAVFLFELECERYLDYGNCRKNFFAYQLIVIFLGILWPAVILTDRKFCYILFSVIKKAIEKELKIK